MTRTNTLRLVGVPTTVLVALFAVEQIVNGLRNGFEHDELPEDSRPAQAIETIATKAARP